MGTQELPMLGACAIDDFFFLSWSFRFLFSGFGDLCHDLGVS